MKRFDRAKLQLTRNWQLPGKERLAGWLKPSKQLNSSLKDGIIWLNSEDIALYTLADSYIEHAILSTGTYEAEIGKLIRISLKPGDTALDIGANIGLQTIRMSQSCGPTGKVFSFEPLNYLQSKFNKNIELNCCVNVSLFPIALSDTQQLTEIKVDENIWNQGTFSLNQTQSAGQTQQLDVRVGDTLPELQNLQQLNLVKIDVEGFEFQVLLGLKNTLSKHKPRIIFEYDSNYWQRTGQSFTSCFDFLSSLGYQLYQITQVACLPLQQVGTATDGNIFAIPV